MFDKDYVFGETEVSCDGCWYGETLDGFDGQPLPYSEVVEDIKEMGWTIKKEGDNWKHFCLMCSDKKSGKYPQP